MTEAAGGALAGLVCSAAVAWHAEARPVAHLVLHLLVPALVARLAWRERWVRAWLVMLAAMVIDLDHLLADPIYDPDRCSLGAHPLHGPVAVALYAVLAALPRTRIAGVGLLLHIALDALDCAWMAVGR